MTASEPRPPAPYFVNGPVDFLAIGGLSILAYIGIGLMDRLDVTWLGWWNLVTVLTFLINWPHFFATSYRLYHTRENIRQYPLTAIAIPIVLVLGAAGSLSWPTVVAPFFIKLFLFWSPYHYAAQSVGISLLYARRAGFVIGGFERWALSSFILSTFIVLTVRENVVPRDQAWEGVIYPSFRLPEWTADLALGWMVLCGVLLAFAVTRWSLRHRRMLPLIVLVPAGAQFCWFVIGASLPLFYIFLAFFHGLQYLFIAWGTQLKEVQDERSIAPSTSFVVRASLSWGVLIFLGGLLLFWLMPRTVAALGVDNALAGAAVVATVNLHHFFVDGVIWKLRNPRVGSILTTSLAELRGATR